MGLTVRDDPPKSVDVASRAWGEIVDGFALSIAQEPGLTLSVVIRNSDPAAKTLTIPGWLHFYRLDIDAPLTAFGKRLLSPERESSKITATLKSGEPVETQVPIGALFEFKPAGAYRAAVSCELPGGKTLTSNSITIRA
jgi:hypothetical protein